MPELAAIIALGSLAAFVLSLAFSILELRQYKNKNFLILQANLKKVGLRWNYLSGLVEVYSEPAQEKEISKALTTYLLFGTAAVLLSWLGLIFLIIIWISLKFLIKNRLQNMLFKSDLALKKLDENEIDRCIKEIKSLGFDSGL